MNKKKFLLTVVSVFLLVAIVGVSWHLAIFGSLYEQMNFITREAPIGALGFIAGILMVLVFAIGLQRIALHEKITPGKGTHLGILLIALPGIAKTLQHAAEHDVGNIGLWLLLEGGLYIILGVVGGAIGGLIYKER